MAEEAVEEEAVFREGRGGHFDGENRPEGEFRERGGFRGGCCGDRGSRGGRGGRGGRGEFEHQWERPQTSVTVQVRTNIPGIGSQNQTQPRSKPVQK